VEESSHEDQTRVDDDAVKTRVGCVPTGMVMQVEDRECLWKLVETVEQEVGVEIVGLEVGVEITLTQMQTVMFSHHEEVVVECMVVLTKSVSWVSVDGEDVCLLMEEGCSERDRRIDLSQSGDSWKTKGNHMEVVGQGIVHLQY